MQQRERSIRNPLIPCLIGGSLGMAALALTLAFGSPAWVLCPLFPFEVLAVAGGGENTLLMFLIAAPHYALYGFAVWLGGAVGKSTGFGLLLVQLALGGWLLLWDTAMPH